MRFLPAAQLSPSVRHCRSPADSPSLRPMAAESTVASRTSAAAAGNNSSSTEFRLLLPLTFRVLLRHHRSRSLEISIRFPPTPAMQVQKKQLVWTFCFSFVIEKKASSSKVQQLGGLGRYPRS